MPSAVSSPAACLQFPALASRSAERLRAVTASAASNLTDKVETTTTKPHTPPNDVAPDKTRQQQQQHQIASQISCIRPPDRTAFSAARLRHTIPPPRNPPLDYNSPEHYCPTSVAFIFRKRTATNPFLIEPQPAAQVQPFLFPPGRLISLSQNGPEGTPPISPAEGHLQHQPRIIPTPAKSTKTEGRLRFYENRTRDHDLCGKQSQKPRTTQPSLGLNVATFPPSKESDACCCSRRVR